MNRNGKIMICLLAVSIIFAFAGSAWAQDIKARMRTRLPVIVSLKAGGIVGENNQGFLTILNQSTDKKDLVAAENQDRRKIYTAIAKKQGTTPELVGQRRAMQIAKKADPGTMVQDAKGKWRKK
ncbi:MAG: YdbL family protein [Desulfobacteraceae bacterium]|jgi:uncharacterized protein YdbL (DUF1318 family)